MRLMVWWNVDYWSVQGEVWQQAVADQTSDVGRWFSYGPTAASVPKCDGNPVRFTSGSTGKEVWAQGSWGSEGEYSGNQSALASFGSPTYAAYLADAMANSWTKNLGIDGYTIDCSANYDQCMMQTNGHAQSDFYNGIVGEVRKTQPQVVMSGEGYGSWNEVINTNSQMGGQGFPNYHTVMQKAVFDGDASNIEDIASTSGADAATVVCYLHPSLDGRQPGACPTMYFRDNTATITNLKQHELWVSLEAGSGIVPEHDYDPSGVWNGAKGVWWNVSNDPSADKKESPLWAFTKFRALNRLAIRTKLNITSSASVAARATTDDGYTAYPKQNCYNGHGGIEYGEVRQGTTVKSCKQDCDADKKCSCVVFDSGTCWKRTSCVPKEFENDKLTAPFAVYVKKNWSPPPPPPKVAGGALAYLKHDAMGPQGDAAIMVFNPGAAQRVMIDLSSLPPALTGGTITPYDLFTNQTASTPLTKKWSVDMRAGEVKAFGGFTLGVFAPRKGKTAGCQSSYTAPSDARTLQACFLDCANDAACENVLVHGKVPSYMEAPAPISCTKLGSIADPSTSCKPASCKDGDSSKCGTLVRRLAHPRRCAHLWRTPTPPAAGAPPVEPPAC